MKIILLLLTMFYSLQALEEYENYEPQSFFSQNDVNAFFSSEAGELLKKIIVNGETYYMQEDGDLYDEDVATIDEIFQIRGSRYSFGKSKRQLALDIYPQHQKAFYSGCDYKIKEKKLIPIHKTCGFHYRKNKNRSMRIEWEHIVPAWHFGHQLKCWQKGGRMNCRQTNTKFRQMEADMHNLVPAIGEINGDRSNFRYGMIEGEKRIYGKVDMEIEFHKKKAEPAPNIYGDIARVYFYMKDRYGLRISKTQEKMFIAWNNLDPVDAWEKEKNQLVKKIQGDENLYVTNYRKIEQLGATKDILSTDFNEVKDELSNRYDFILNKLSAPLSATLLFLATAFVVYRRKKQQSAQQPKEQNQQKEPSTEPKEESTPTKSKKFIFISKLGDVAISINDKEEIIIEKVDKNSPKQQWVLTKANKAKEYFFIENSQTGKVITIENSDSNDGAKIILSKKLKRKNDHQEWKFEKSKDKGYVFIVSKWSLNVLDIKYKKTKDGTKLQSFHKKVRGTENQEWRVETL